jgi:hypothetical protein
LTKEEIAEVIDQLAAAHTRPRSRAAQATFTGEQARVHDALRNPLTSALQDERDRILARARMMTAREQANIVLNAAKAAERLATYRAAPSPELGIQAKLVGSNTAFQGNRASAEAHINANKADLLGSFHRELAGNNLDTAFMSGAMEREWATELFELNRRGGNPGVGGNRPALRIAEAVQRLQQRSMGMLNAEGAFVARYDSYIAKTTHSPDRLLNMGVDAWLGLARQYFDLDTMFPNQPAAYIDNALRGEFKELVGAGESFGPEGVFKPTSRNVAAAVSESRSIHFASADAWLGYMAAASDLTPSQVIVNSALKAGRDAGLMRVWGTNPKHALETDFVAARTAAVSRGDAGAVQKLDDAKRSFDLWMSYMTGEAGGVKNRTRAAIVQNVLTVQRLAKLGMLPIAQLTDLASIAGELRYQGVGFIDRMTGGILGAYFRGGMNSEKRQVGALLGSFVDGWLGHMNVQLEIADPQMSGTFTGALSQAQHFFFRYSGAAWMTDAAREAGVTMMARHFGGLRGRAFADIGQSEARIMRSFDIGPAEWEALNAAPWTIGNHGNVYLTPDVAGHIPDAAADAWITASGRSDLTRDQARDTLGNRVRSYFADRQDYAVLNPGVRERAAMYHGTAADNPLGIALRLTLQFKSFMFASVLRQWGREVHGGQGALGAAYGVTQFAVTATALGLVSNGLAQLLKGQDPRSQWDERPGEAIAAGFLRGGGASIVGDFLVGEFNRHGSGLAEYLAGPTVADATKALSAWGRMRSGDNPAGDLVSLARGITPFQNWLWTKLATDYLIWNGLAELANPGFQKRTERRLKKTQGVQFFNLTSPENWRAF